MNDLAYDGRRRSQCLSQARTDATTSSYRSLFCHTPPALDAAVNFNSLQSTWLDRGIQSAMEMLRLNEGRVLHIPVVLTAPPRLSYMHLLSPMLRLTSSPALSSWSHRRRLHESINIDVVTVSDVAVVKVCTKRRNCIFWP